MTYIIATICGVLCLVLDQVTKYLVSSNMVYGESHPIIKGVFNLTYINNGGAAFGMLQGKTWLLLSLTFFMMLICVGMIIKKTYRTPLIYWSVMLILAGGIGNMIDRFLRGGQVVDFIETAFIDFPVFNVADISVCVGAGLMFLYFLIDIMKTMRKNKPTTENFDEFLGKENKK